MRYICVCFFLFVSAFVIFSLFLFLCLDWSWVVLCFFALLPFLPDSLIGFSLSLYLSLCLRIQNVVFCLVCFVCFYLGGGGSLVFFSFWPCYMFWDLAHRNRSDFRDLRLRCPSRTPKIARFLRQEKAMLHCDLRVRWKVASDLRFRAAISEPETPFFCGISGVGSVNAEIASDCDCAILVR